MHDPKPNCFSSTHLHQENCQKRKYSHSHTPPHSMVQPSSQSGKTINHKQAVYRPKYLNCHTWSLWRWYLSVLGISCTRYLLLEHPIENTETPRERSTWIPTKHIFSPDQFFTELQWKPPHVTCLSSIYTLTSNTTLSPPPEKPSTFSPPRNRELRRKWNWIQSLWLSWGPRAWNGRHCKGGKNSPINTIQMLQDWLQRKRWNHLNWWTMRNNSYAPHYEISIYSIREFNTGAEPFMVAIIIIIIIL